MKHRMKPLVITAIGLLVLMVMSLGGVSAQGPENTDSWTNPNDPNQTITFTTVENYDSCTSTFDRIYTTGIPADWSLTGSVSVFYVLPDGSQELAPDGYYDINQTGDLDLTINYPPVAAWPVTTPYRGGNGDLREIHISLSIIVRDETGALVTWVGNDPVRAPATLGPGQPWDVFCVGSASLGDRAWVDQNRNGLQDPGEPGLAGVKVTLLDVNMDPVPLGNASVNPQNPNPTVTDANGNYQFRYLPPGDYYVQFDTPSGYTLTTQKVGNDTTIDSDPDPATGKSGKVTLQTGENNPTIDAGYVLPPEEKFTLGDRVWYDQNQNGIQDSNEPGYNGVTVDLYNNATCSGNSIASTTTMAGPAGFGDGYYQFTDLLAGDYCVQFGNIPAGWSISPADQGNGANDSSANGNAQIPNISLTQNDPNEDMGIYVPGSLGDSVVCVSTGQGLANITVSLFEDFDGNGQPDGAAIATTQTDANGIYQFTGLEVALAGGSNITKYVVRVDTTDADLGVCNVPVPPTEYNPPLDSNTPNDPNNDFEFQKPAPRFTLGDRVWYDQNQNGLQDANEPGYNGATVELYNNATCSGNSIASTTTAAGPAGFGDGYYQFTDLLAGDYCVQFGNIPAGWSISPADQGNGANDSSANGSAQIPNISLTQNDPNEDMGIYVPGSLGDSVVCVSTGDPLANITVTLFEDFDGDGVADGPAIATTSTDANGKYQFSGLEVALAGDPNNTTKYIVRVDTTDADLGTCNVPTPPTEYNPPLDSNTPNDPNNDFSFTEQPATVGDRVWYDNNGDGVQDAGEPGIPGVTVNLTDCSGNVLATDVTDASGNYLFDNLAAGTYCVVIDQTTLPANVQQTFEKDGSLNGDTQQPLAPGDDIRDVDFGYQPLASVGDRVWQDNNGDGVQDAGEPGIPGVTVNLTDCSGNVLATDVTDASGNYLFDNLTAGTYCVVIDQTTLPANVQQTFEKDGSLNGDTQQPLAPGDDIRDVDFGYQPLGAIGDTVWRDDNGNGVQDAGEPGIPNVTVNLNDPGPDGMCGTADDVFIASDVTDMFLGSYLFTDLPQGTYCVDPDETTVPAGYTLTTNNDPQTVNLGPGETFLDADFGYQPPRFTLGDRVWYDQNQNGIQDPNEPGYNGATVELYDNATCSGNSIASTTTAAGPAGFGDGYYQFANLLAGDYCVQFGNIPAGWSISPADQGNGANDSSANGSAQIPNISLTQNDPNEDMGIYVPGSLGDSVVCVSTGDPLANITVTLFEDFDGDGVADGPAIATTSTDANGKYQFSGLEVALAGDPNNTTKYIVRVDTTDADLGTCNVPTPPTEYNPPLDSNTPNDPNNDFSFTERPATVGDRVWYDNNGDGVQDAGEPGIPGVTVNLTDCSGNVLATDVTDASGNYLFDNLAAGTYCVVIDQTTLPANVQQTFEKDGSLNGDTQQPLAPGDDIRDVDFGYQPLASLGDFVWNDLNANGIQDQGEPGIPGVTVRLRTCASATVIATTSTDATGFYSFTGLTPDCYRVRFAAPAGFVFSPANQGNDDTVDSDAVPNPANPANGVTGPVDLGPGEDNPNVDAGLYQSGSIGDTVFNDINKNGVQDGGEPGIPGVTVNLNTPGPDNVCGTADDVFIASDVTDANGNYLFTDLPQGTYCVDPDETTVPAGFELTTNNDPQTVNLGPGETFLDADFGYYLPASLGNRVWEDANGNGVQDGGESGIPGATVNLLDPGPDNTCNTGDEVQLATTTTGAGGIYGFTSLAAGDYCVEFLPPVGYVFTTQNTGNDDTIDSDADPATGQTGNISLVPGQYDPTNDAGLYRPASLGDFVWSDTNRNGVQDTGEPGISGATVNLLDPGADNVCNSGDETQLDTTTTGAGGIYGFANLAPGAYCVEFVAPSGYVFTTQNAGNDDTIDSDADPATGQTGNISLVSGQDDPTWDAGFFIPLCDLLVDKKCAVPLAPTTPFVCSNAKPIDEVAMVWNGSQNVRIKAWKGAVGSTLLADIDNIAPGEVVTVTGYAGAPNDVYWEVFVAGTSTKLGESTFHLSCSDSNMNGPEDCGLPQGDGKSDNSSLLNDWLLEGLAGNGERLDCTPTPPTGSDQCDLTLGGAPSCDLLGKPTSLTFKYTGGGCLASNNPQGGKATCSGSIDPNAAVTVASSNGYSIVPQTVQPGEEFTVSASGFNADSFFTLSNGSSTESLKIHTSCSQLLEVGNVFGSLTLVAFNGQRAGSEVTYFYDVTNNGDALTDVFVDDDQLGQIAGPFPLAPGETRTFSQKANIFDTTTNVATVAGLLNLNGQQCAAPADSVTVTVTEPCAVCKGGTTELTLEYQGAAAANVTVYDKGDNSDASKVLFQGLVQPGELITLKPRSGQDKLNNDISLYVNGALNAKIHTSCSQPIGPNLVAGDFKVTEARSKDNGLMCALNACAPQATDSLVFEADRLKWVVTNNGDLGLEVKQVSLSWPAAFGNLVEMKVNGTFFKGALPPTSAVVNSGWAGNVGDRTINPGDTKTFEFKFANNVSLVGDVAITIDFTAGCSITVGYQAPVSGGNFACAKPIDALTMIWDGSSDVTVKAWKGSVGSSQLLANQVPVPVGGELTVSGYAGSPNDVYWEIFNTSGVKLGESTFHLSCSDDAMNGPEDCGSRQGDGKDKTGFLNDWILEGMVDAKTTLNCTAP